MKNFTKVGSDFFFSYVVLNFFVALEKSRKELGKILEGPCAKKQVERALRGANIKKQGFCVCDILNTKRRNTTKTHTLTNGMETNVFVSLERRNKLFCRRKKKKKKKN